MIRELSPDDAGPISRTWKSKRKGTSENMRDSILTAGSLGVYVGRECVSWIVNSTNGHFYALNVKPEYRGQGFGEMTLAGMAKSTALKGLVPNGHVQFDNRVSFNLFEKVGFECCDALEDIKYVPLPIILPSPYR